MSRPSLDTGIHFHTFYILNFFLNVVMSLLHLSKGTLIPALQNKALNTSYKDLRDMQLATSFIFVNKNKVLMPN